jgi:hypothetical protein
MVCNFSPVSTLKALMLLEYGQNIVLRARGQEIREEERGICKKSEGEGGEGMEWESRVFG